MTNVAKIANYSLQVCFSIQLRDFFITGRGVVLRVARSRQAHDIWLVASAGKSLDHYMLTMEKVRQAEPAPSQALDDLASASPLSTPGASPPNPAQSYLSGLPSRLGMFWSSPETGTPPLLSPQVWGHCCVCSAG